MKLRPWRLMCVLRNERGKCVILLCGLLADGVGGIRVSQLLRFALAKREAVLPASQGAEHVEAPRLSELVVRRENGGVEKRFDLLARDRAPCELLDRAPSCDGVRDFHG